MADWKDEVRKRLTPAQLDPTLETDVVEELTQHLNDLYRELRANGTSEEEATRLVLTELDNRDLPAHAARLAHREPRAAQLLGVSGPRQGYFSAISHDFKIALRHIRIKPLFSLMVIGMLALGIAGNAAIFSIFNGLFLRPLPFAEPAQLVDVDETAPRWNLSFVGVSAADFYVWRKANSTFDDMAFFRAASYNLSDRETAQRVDGAQVTREMLNVLRLEPFMGRNFSAEEDRPGGAKVVLLNYGLWQRTFRGDRGVVGRILKLDDEAYTVIGVLPRDAVFPDRASLWTPLAADPNNGSSYYVNGVGRLKPGVSIEQARADLLRVHKAMIADGRKVNEITSPVLMPLRDRYLGDFKTVSRVLLGAVGIVLLIVCVNVAALMLVRGAARSREIAIRTAMGASRLRIAAQLLTENLVLAAAGGAIGIALGAMCLRLMISRMPDDMPQWLRFSLDWRFAMFCMVITSATALLFGLAPTLQALRVDLRASLQDNAMRSGPSRGRRIAFSALIVCEVALALMLSVSAGLLLVAFRKVLQVDPGFRPENVLTFRISVPETTYSTPEQKISYYNALLEQLRALPGVRAAGATSAPPLGGQWGGIFEAEGGRSFSPQGENPEVLRIAATPGYLEAIGMTLLEGRAFEQRDDNPDAAPVVMVNETFAKVFWHGGSPVGKRIRPPGGKDWYQVVGLLRDEKHFGLEKEMMPSVFHSYGKTILTVDQNDARALQQMTIVLRGYGDPKMLAGAVHETVRQLDPDVPMYEAETMTERLDRSLWARRAYSWLFGVFAGIAILLAAAGVYGIVSYAVSQRTREIGIRIALGAQPGQVLRQILLGGMTVVSIGTIVGLLGIAWGAGLLRTLLFGVSAQEPLVYAAVVAGVLGVGALANFVPASRAARVDPIRALHFE